MTIKQQIQESMMRYTKEQLVEMNLRGMEDHNAFCRRADRWRKAMLMMARALKPLADLANELDEEANNALQVGGYVPTTEEWATATILTRHLYAARESFGNGPAELSELYEKYEAEFKAARLCVKTLQDLEQQGNTAAAQTLAKVRQVDPHI